MTNLNDTFDILAAIKDGRMDDDLTLLEAAIAQRKRLTAPPPMIPTSGTNGKLKNVRPLYLNGAPFTVVQMNRTRAVVRLDSDWLDAHPQAKRRWSGRVTVPLEMMDLAS